MAKPANNRKPPPIYKKGPGISVQKEAALRKCFVLDMEASKAAATAGVSNATAHLHFKRYREAIYATFSQYPRLEGEVEIDIAEFGGKGRKRLRDLLKKYAKVLNYFEYQEKAKAIRAANKTNVLCFAERGGRVYAHVIKSKARDDLLPLVRLIVEKGAKIYSDEEPGLARLGQDGYVHKTVNHSEFHAYEAGVHTANVDAFVSVAKRRLAKFNGLWPHTTPLHIKECLWRYNNRDKSVKDLEQSFKSLLANHQNPLPRRAGKSTSPARRPPRQNRARVRIRRTPHTGSPPRPRVRVRRRA